MASYTISDASLQPAEVQLLHSLTQRANEVTYSAAHNNGITAANVAARDAGTANTGALYGNISAGVH